MEYQMSNLAWVRGHSKRGEGSLPNIQTASYRMSDLLNRGFFDPTVGHSMLMEAGLVDLLWKVTWAEDFATEDADLEARLSNVEGYVIFIHGWTGNHSIWEELPEMIVRDNRRLVAISIDHNGFGAARFVDETPSLNTCCPPSAMRTAQKLVDVLKIRRQPGDPNPKVINFVGHSMGGAALFYLDPLPWRMGEETRYAIAPALLLNDSLHKAFFTALGMGIGIVERIRLFEPIERFVKPNMVQTVCEGSSEYVKETHIRQYNDTPRGITGATFQAMGMLQDWEIPRNFGLFRVMLGHKDFLVSVTSMMDLLSGLEFPASNVRVVAGSHYMFSIGRESAFQHAQNRELAADDILDLHYRAYTLQKTGKPVTSRMG